ncbi:cobalamin-binding protein [Parabacteroides sp. AM58-2XD]|jgi:corrinoid protein of di/trimethylamine methyltransferase|uniref:Corrinoid protein n=1 Tax=Parabacteroides segnis TaxID=2763058 RepID=A0ABR7E1G8_9BACT|nr:MULTISPECIES: corrinoid protein [Parabacteroides]MBC5642909.1 corrinoid protein [Parabacteroides segnis]MCM0713060.1 corrinoid protein [Parabacteroides sp. TA-V-105]RGY94706.1 cobalamin-binding protein [Parabacteroides sp. AM58-2XD]
MENTLERIALCVEVGKINAKTPYPPAMKGEDGADELTLKALEQGYSPNDILTKGLIVGMNNIGVKFKENKVFVPQVLMSAKAMSGGMQHLKRYFNDGSVKRKGKLIIGTVKGDLHDIGKNLVCMMVEGNGYEIIDLGVDVTEEKFVDAVRENPDAFVGMSALLTTTMVNMESINTAIKTEFPQVKTFIGGAPVSSDFAQKIGADYYTEEPQRLVEILNQLTSN